MTVPFAGNVIATVGERLEVPVHHVQLDCTVIVLADDVVVVHALSVATAVIE